MKHTSLKLSKKLYENGCKLESEWVWTDMGVAKMDKEYPNSKFVFQSKEVNKKNGNRSYYPAYDLLWDICVKYAKEFFGEKGWNTKWEDLEKLHKWKLDRIEFDTGETKIYGCEICDAEKINNVIYFSGCDGQRVKRKPCCYASHYLKDHEAKYNEGFNHHSQKVLSLLQQNKKQKAEDYIWEHCKFNPKNNK